MMRALLALLTRRRECADCGNATGALHCDGCHNSPAYCVCDVVDLVPVDCAGCGFPADYCACTPGEHVPHDLSDYDDYMAAAMQPAYVRMRKCRECGMKTAFLVGDVYFVRHHYDAPRDPMCVACQALLSEPVTR